MVSAFLNISTGEQKNEFFMGKRVNGGKLCVKLAIHPVALPHAVRRFTKDRVAELYVWLSVCVCVIDWAWCGVLCCGADC